MNLKEAALTADAFRQDPEVIEAMDLICQRLARHQEGLAPRPSDEALADDYVRELDRFAANRGGGTFFPYLGSGFGRGPLVELRDGRVLYDCITGIGAFPAGHSDPRIVRSHLEGALSDLVIQGNLQQNGESADFVDLLVREACTGGADLRHCFLSSTGVMAGENSLKLALQKHAPAHRVLAFEGCFAGRTITFSQITDKPAFREGLPESLSVDYVPFFDPADPDAARPPHWPR
jgi:Ornithine/acetylornithine aminotransferase